MFPNVLMHNVFFQKNKLIGFNLKEVIINDKRFNWDRLSKEEQQLVQLFQKVSEMVASCENEVAVFNLAKKNCIATLKSEILFDKTGLKVGG